MRLGIINSLARNPAYQLAPLIEAIRFPEDENIDPDQRGEGRPYGVHDSVETSTGYIVEEGIYSRAIGHFLLRLSNHGCAFRDPSSPERLLSACAAGPGSGDPDQAELAALRRLGTVGNCARIGRNSWLPTYPIM